MLNKVALNEALIRTALDDHAAATRDIRGDEDQFHVSDLTGCTRAIWARLTNKTLLPFSGDRLRTFLFGFRAEDFVIDAIRQITPVEEGVEALLDRFLIGHPDGVTDEAVLEVKSTEFLVDRQTWQRIVPRLETDLPMHYRIQASAYAIALDKPKAFVIVVCRATGMLAVIEIHPEKYRATINDHLKRLRGLRLNLELGDHEMPEPYLPADTINKRTGESWMCKYCSFAACEKNRNPLKGNNG